MSVAVTLYSFRKSRPVLSNGNKTFVKAQKMLPLKRPASRMCLEFDVWRDHIPVVRPFLRIFFAFIFVTRASSWRLVTKLRANCCRKQRILLRLSFWCASQRVCDAGKCQVARHFCISLVVMLSCVYAWCHIRSLPHKHTQMGFANSHANFAPSILVVRRAIGASCSGAWQ